MLPCTHNGCTVLSMTAQVKSDRLSIRIDHESAQLLRSAAECRHMTLSQFVINSTAIEARHVLADQQVFSFSEDAWNALNAVFERRAKINKAMLTALERPRKFEWAD